MAPAFNKSVFINCPFDAEYAPILQAIAFCIVDLGFYPRIAPENSNNSAMRLDRIITLIESSKYGIHDISRCKVSVSGEYSRLNMPFELGIDYGCKTFGSKTLVKKSVLILESQKHSYQRSLSDIAGWDIEAHNDDFIIAVRKVNNWLTRQSKIAAVGSQKIQTNYETFQEWYWKKCLADGASEEDIKDYPTVQMIESMHDWVRKGRPSAT